MKKTPPPAIDLARNVDRTGLSHGDLPYHKAGARPVSQPSAAKPIPMVRLTWDLSAQLASFLYFDLAGMSKVGRRQTKFPARASGTRAQFVPWFLDDGNAADAFARAKRQSCTHRAFVMDIITALLAKVWYLPTAGVLLATQHKPSAWGRS